MRVRPRISLSAAVFTVAALRAYAIMTGIVLIPGYGTAISRLAEAGIGARSGRVTFITPRLSGPRLLISDYP